MMINPLQNKFLKAKNCDTVVTWITIFASANAIATIIIAKSVNTCQDCLMTISDLLACVFLIAIAFFSFIRDLHQNMAEGERRKTSVDNAYGKGYAEQPSKDYYTNDGVKIGLGKFSLNNFESCFFTYNIAHEMAKPVRALAGLSFLSIATSLIIRDATWFPCICNLGIISLVISDWVRLEVLCCKTREILKRYRIYYSTMQNADRSSKDSERILLALDYEAALSWAHILLSEDVYNKYNERLSREWNENKSNYHLS